MLERLKTLPLTIALTILIWMYAEAQTLNQPGLPGTPPVGVVPPTNAAVGTVVIPKVPIWIAGPPEIMAHAVTVRPAAVDVTLVGPAAEIQKVRTAVGLSPRPAEEVGVRAYVDLTAADVREEKSRRRQIRYVLPAGLEVRDAPNDVEISVGNGAN